MREPKVPPRAALKLLFATVVFIILAITMLIVGIVVYLLVQAGVIEKIGPPNVMFPIVVIALASILVGTIVATIMSRIPLKPVNILISGMNRLASGD